jgi:hypothetical protein
MPELRGDSADPGPARVVELPAQALGRPYGGAAGHMDEEQVRASCCPRADYGARVVAPDALGCLAINRVAILEQRMSEATLASLYGRRQDEDGHPQHDE